MLSRVALCALSLSPFALAQGGAVVINEFIYDNLGGDNIEFVELYNRSGGPIDVGDWVLESEDPNGPNSAHTIPTGTMLAAGGRWTMGADLANPGNINQVLGTSNLWENSNESLTLKDATGAVIDTLVYEAVRGIWDPTLAEGAAGLQAQHVTSNTNPYSWSRCPDGADTDDNAADFAILPYTPGAANFSSSLLPYSDDYEGFVPGDTIPEFTASFVDPTVIDPTVAANGNPSVIPASPSGGNALICWDPTGGGDACYMETECVGDFVFTAEVYIDGALTPALDGETWNIGRGAVGAFGHHVDPTGTFYTSINATFWLPGNSGVAVCWQRNDSYNRLFLMDYADGSGATVLGTIDVTPGVNDGWRTLSLSVVGNSATMSWAGTTVNGSVGASTPSTGGLYIAYREFRIDNSTTRPPTLDGVSIDDCINSLTTPPNFVSNNGGAVGGMVYFTLDVTAAGGVSLCGLDVNTSVGAGAPINGQVFLHQSITDVDLLDGTNNSETDWCLVGLITGTGNGQNMPSPCVVVNGTNSIDLPAGQYLLGIGNGDFDHDYTNGTGCNPGNQCIADANLGFRGGKGANVIYAASTLR